MTNHERNKEKIDFPEVDWSKVETDTPILVRDSEDEEWLKRHFAGYSFGKVHAFAFNMTSKDYLGIFAWKYAKLMDKEDD